MKARIRGQVLMMGIYALGFGPELRDKEVA